ncbi:MAG TPA: condensation domain-containing protein, partial [Candidatus Angelobacter sp.]|nr:condensation domain-containing protein [Candidatus Angelobacter sp.]
MKIEEKRKYLQRRLLAKLANSRPTVFPLSYAQQRLWFIAQLEPESAAYNCQGAVRLSGELDAGALERSLREIVRRHEVLRTRFLVQDGVPMQEIAAEVELHLGWVDLSGMEEEEREKEAQRVTEEEAGRGFDLSRGPLLRVGLLRLGEREHVLLLTLHHVVSDGWSVGIFLRELGRLYAAYRAGEESPLAELPIQYADFAQWQREWLQGEVLEEQLKYWREQLAGLPALELPTDHARPTRPSRQAGQVRFALPKELTQQLKAVSQQEGVTMFMTLLAAFQLVLGRYAGQRDVAVGTDVANRTRQEVEGLIGFFVNQLVLRTELGEGESLRSLLGQVRERTLEAYAHQDLPFEKLVEEL